MKKSINKISSLILTLALIISALTVPSVLGTAATSEETGTDKMGSYEFDFDNDWELAGAYSNDGNQSLLPKISQDGDKNVLEMNSKNITKFAKLPFKLEAGKTYNYTISYRVASQGEITPSDAAKSTLIKLMCAGDSTTHQDLLNVLNGGSGKDWMPIVAKWAKLSVSEDYQTFKGSFKATADLVTEDRQYLTLSYQTNNHFEQTIYIDKITIYEALSDITGSYTFDFENPAELQAQYTAKNSILEIVNDNGKKAVSMTSYNYSVNEFQLPYVLEANKTYKYTVKYKISSETSKIGAELEFFSISKKSGTVSSMTSGAAYIARPLAWNTKDDGRNDYAEANGTFSTNSTNVTDTQKYLTVLYKTGGNVTQSIFIDSIAIEEIPTGSISFNAGDVTVDKMYNLAVGSVVPLPVPEKEGYYFDGWYTDADCENSVGLTYPVTAAEEVTLYGKWEEKTTPAAPAAPKMVSHTQYSVTLEETAGYEYSIDGGTTWQLSPEFTGLFTGVEYSFTQRVAETKTANASPASAAFTYTIAAYGDANADGAIDDSDLTAIRTALLNSEDKQAEDGFNANGDDAFDIRDLVCASEIMAAQASTTTKTLINNADITEFTLTNSTGNENIANAFTNAVKGRTNSNFADESEKTIEISLDDTLEDESYNIYVKNGNMYITAKAEDILLKAVNVLCDRIATYGADKILNLQEGYTFSGSYPTVKYIAFTFDDAPTAKSKEDAYIETFVKTLSNYGGAGTLFVVGDRITSYGYDQLSYAFNNGFEIGNHTMKHTDFVTTDADEDTIKSEITGVNTLLKDNLGYTARWLRPGNLSVNNTVYKVAKELYMPVIGSDDTALDWKSDSTSDSIKNNVISKAYDGQIVLMHAWKADSAACFEEIVSTLYKKGYRFVTVSELIAIKDNGAIPTNGRIKAVTDAGYKTY